jgi:hypothetical protein
MYVAAGVDVDGAAGGISNHPPILVVLTMISTSLLFVEII